MRQTHLDPNDMSRMTTTTRAVETPRPMSDTQKKVVAGAVLFGVPAASLFGFGSMGLGLWIFWYLFFYTPVVPAQALPTVLPTFTVVVPVPIVPVVTDTPVPTFEYRLRTQTQCSSFIYPVVDVTYIVGEYLSDSYFLVVGQYPQPVPSPDTPVWYLLADGSWLLQSCFYPQDRPTNLLPKSPGLIPPTVTPVPTNTPTPTFTPLPTATNTPTVIPTATYFVYLPPVPVATLTPTITPTPTNTPQFLSLVQSLPVGAVPPWCVKIPSPPVLWVELFGTKYDAYGGGIESDGFIYLGPTEVVLHVPIKVRGEVSGVPVEREVVFDQCGSWTQR